MGKLSLSSLDSANYLDPYEGWSFEISPERAEHNKQAVRDYLEGILEKMLYDKQQDRYDIEGEFMDYTLTQQNSLNEETLNFGKIKLDEDLDI